jgi:anti-sigma regulatory factor (Ser/Thr protein kinase)
MMANESCVTCWDGASEESLQDALAPPATQCFEADLIDECHDDVVCTQPAPGHLSLVVTTRSAYRHSIVKAFMTAMQSRTSLSEDLRIRVYSAVQEALMNAVLHGNLRIDPHLRDNLAGLLAAQEAIEARLNAPEVARTMIRVDAIWNASTLNVVIQDSGEGYDETTAQPVTDESACGRGLAILQAFSDKVAVLNGGTTVKLEFRL